MRRLWISFLRWMSRPLPGWMEAPDEPQAAPGRCVFIDRLGCGRPAFYLDRMPVHGERISSAHARRLDGTRPAYGSRITCGSCGRWINDGLPTSYVEPVS